VISEFRSFDEHQCPFPPFFLAKLAGLEGLSQRNSFPAIFPRQAGGEV